MTNDLGGYFPTGIIQSLMPKSADDKLEHCVQRCFDGVDAKFYKVQKCP